MSDKDIVSAVRANLADKIGRDRFDVWFGPATRLTFDGKALVVEAASKFSRDWLRTHYRRQIEAACGAAAGNAVAVEFRVDESLTAQQRRCSASQPCLSTAVDSATHPAGHARPEPAIASPASIRLHRAAAGAAIAAPYPKPAASGNTPKNAADQISRRRFATLESFVIGQTNRLAQASAQMVAERPGCLTPLMVYGPTGCGKTHLLEGVFSATRRRPPALNAVYLAAEQFTTLFVEALRGSGLPSFRRKYRGVDLLIIDDLQFLVRARATRIELLHTIDALAREGRQLVFSADRPPAELSELGPELTTRLAGGMVCKMEPPDLHTRIGLVHHFANRLEIDLPDDVAQYTAAQITAGAREISGAVNRLHAASRMFKRALDLPLAEESLSDCIRHATRGVRLADIERAVCEVFGLPTESLQTNRRTKNVSTPRMLAMWLARKHTRAGLSEIGQYFGRRSHSTVISAQKRVADLLAKQMQVDLSDRPCVMDEAIRRVEEKLRAG